MQQAGGRLPRLGHSNPAAEHRKKGGLFCPILAPPNLSRRALVVPSWLAGWGWPVCQPDRSDNVTFGLHYTNGKRPFFVYVYVAAGAAVEPLTRRPEQEIVLRLPWRVTYDSHIVKETVRDRQS